MNFHISFIMVMTHFIIIYVGNDDSRRESRVHCTHVYNVRRKLL